MFHVIWFSLWFAVTLWFTQPKTIQTTDAISTLCFFLTGWCLYDVVRGFLCKKCGYDENERKQDLPPETKNNG